MEGRTPAALHLEMVDLGADAYLARSRQHFADARVTLFENCRRDRTDLPRTIPDFDLLAVHEVEADAPMPHDDGSVGGSYRFVRSPRPGQGSLAAGPTTGLELVLISPENPEKEQELRDWGDFVHIRHIAEAGVPGFRMITPYRNPGEGPRFLHLYELQTHDPEATFQTMTPTVAARLGGTGGEAYRTWAWHPQLRIDYVNTFRRVTSG